MVLITASTTISSNSIVGISVLLLQLLLILQIPAHTNANGVFSNKVVPVCEAGCHCFGSEGNCPSFPIITDSMIPTFRALNHTNPMAVLCDPFLATTCVPEVEEGEACVVELIASGSSCPSEYTYRLKTVSSLVNATAAGQYITHKGACGTCSSLQDLALMLEYPDLPYKAQQCFFRSTAVKYVDKAEECYEEIGFTKACSTTLAYHQKRIVDKECGYQCAAWSYDGDLGKPNCQDVSGCGACVDRLGISTRLELMAGRTFANSGYPSQKAQQCIDIAPVDVIGGSDICSLAPLAQFPTEAPVVSIVPTISPVDSTTTSPTTEPVGNSTVAPTESPVDVTASPTEGPVPTVPTAPTVPSLTLQQCQSTAAIEVRNNALSGGSGVFCDCSEAESGATNLPKCYSSPDRDADSSCALKHESCSVKSCCGGRCKNNVCRPPGRDNKDALRISSGFGGSGGRNDRGNSRALRRGA
mmetsp:Transcript_15437/g.31975  ORF Transcript_15437/g.31975 Transcript_15437/m.31975 type:complete len:471 (+) Transcript_15437:516-1928(+)